MTTSERIRPPHAADERTTLIGWLDLQRSIVRWKCEGLNDDDARRVVVETSPLTTMAGLVSHLRWTEHCWFEVIFLDQNETQNPQFFDEPEDADMMTGDVPLAQLLAEYEQQCAISNAIIAEHSFDDIGVHRLAGGANLRWMAMHMLEETARHAGHAHLVRELIDGSKGYY